jgi:hypothetical protein
VSEQIDLHTSGLFLGRSKRLFGNISQIASSDPISDKADCPAEEVDLSQYGLSHRGKRKFIVQNNLQSGCRHNLAIPEEVKPSPRRSASAPAFPRIALPAPYHQDELPPEVEEATKSNFNEYGNAHVKHRNPKRDEDQVWFDKLASKCGGQFAELKDLNEKTNEQILTEEFKLECPHRKKCFGNVHNESYLKLDYADDPTWKSDHITFMPLGKTDQEHLDGIDLRTHPFDYVKWGRGHGRQKFKVNDHLDKDDDGVECYVSVDGTRLAKMKRTKVEDHLDADHPADDVPCFFLDPDGKAISFRPRQYVPVKDTLNDLLDEEVQSENSDSLAVTGKRRRHELIRPKSARRFPLKDTFRQPARSSTPPARAGSASQDRRKWQL